MACLYQEQVLTVNADSTEFCPLTSLQHVLAVGTYELDDSTQQRNGLLHLYTMSSTGPSDSADAVAIAGQSISRQLKEEHILPISGIFDMRWHPCQPACLLAACADGSLHMLSLQQSASTCQLSAQQQITISEGAMATSLDIASSGLLVVASSSAGTVSALQVCVWLHHCITQWHIAYTKLWCCCLDFFSQCKRMRHVNKCHGGL